MAGSQPNNMVISKKAEAIAGKQNFGIKLGNFHSSVFSRSGSTFKLNDLSSLATT